MKVRDLIVALKNAPADADVVFGPEEGDRIPIEGGIVGRDTVTAGGWTLILAPISLKDVGGF